MKIYKQQYIEILRLAAPVMLSQVGVVSVQLFDNAMVGKLGALPLAAVAFGGTVFFLVFIFALGLSLALTPLVGEQYAKGKEYSITAYFHSSLILYPLVAILAFGLQHALIPLMYYMGQPAEVVDMAIPYYKCLVWSILPFMLFSAFKQFLEGLGNTSVNMIIIITANLINILFNWLLIYGNWGFPRLEALGAGVATLISRVCMPVFIILFFLFSKQYKGYLSSYRPKNITSTYIISLLRVGFPIALQMLMEGSAFILTSIMMGWIGTVQIAANQIALTLSSFAFMIIVGLGSASTIRVSHEYGRKNPEDLRKAANASYHLTFLWNCFTALFFILFRHQIAGVFSSDPEVLAVASHLLIFVAIFQFSDGLQCISVSILRGIQDVKQIMFIAFFSYIVVNLPVGYLLAFKLGLGASGLWMGFIFGLSVAAVLLISRYRKQSKRLMEILK